MKTSVDWIKIRKIENEALSQEHALLEGQSPSSEIIPSIPRCILIIPHESENSGKVRNKKEEETAPTEVTKRAEIEDSAWTNSSNRLEVRGRANILLLMTNIETGISGYFPIFLIIPNNESGLQPRTPLARPGTPTTHGRGG